MRIPSFRRTKKKSHAEIAREQGIEYQKKLYASGRHMAPRLREDKPNVE